MPYADPSRMVRPSRARRDGGTWTNLPLEYRERAPRWPLRDRMPTTAEAALWAEVWRSPQASVWAKQQMVWPVCRWVKLNLAAVDGDLACERACQSLEDRLGLNPMAMARLRWRVVEDAAPALAPVRRISVADRAKLFAE